MNESIDMNRRTVLKTTGGLLSIAGLSSTAAANGTQDKNYGNGNGIGAFLNEEATFKEHPIWTGDIADRRGEEVVDVAVGAMTSVDAPDPEAPDAFPVAFAPQVVKVSPGATVRWTWVSNPFDFPLPHDVRSLVDVDGEPVLEPDEDVRFHHYDKYTPVDDGDDINPTFEFTFDDRGNHLYYCTPHGAPFEVHGHYNALGMRGAVKVADKPL